MGRPSKLTDKQWGEIGRRLAQGEPLRALAREYRVGASRISERFSERVTDIKQLAATIAGSEMEFERLPVSEQCSVRTLADQLKGIESNYMQATDRSSRTAVKMARLAGRIADDMPEDLTSADAVASAVAVTELTKTMNLALQPASTMITASKRTPGGGDDRPLHTPEQLRRMAELQERSK